jgi:hypothetical protein
VNHSRNARSCLPRRVVVLAFGVVAAVMPWNLTERGNELLDRVLGDSVLSDT